MTESNAVLLHIFVVLVAAKGAAELAERLRLPVVVAEIVAGALIGPSLLGLVGHDDVLRVLGEIGVILLLLEVGLQMEISDLVKVGASSLLVAVIGVAAPFAGGYVTAILFGETTRTAVFLGAALTATSVGITARVFTELRALARIEARTVIGAAVADDVLGLVILTVVLGVSTGGALSIIGVSKVVAVAVAFLAAASIVGVRLAPRLFAAVHDRALSAGTYTAVSLAFSMSFSLMAAAANLAPIVGAFVAGLSLAGTRHADRVRTSLAPVGHLFIPVFFLQIGIDVRVQTLANPTVVAMGCVLLAVAVGGKLVSSFGALHPSADKLLVGLGMIPRGEVGLIFAGLGLRHGLLGRDLYSALLFVILATTLVTPPLLRRRLARPARTRAAARERGPAPADWLVTENGLVEIADIPPPHVDALELALRASLLVEKGRPGARLLDWLGSLDRRTLVWSAKGRAAFFDVLRSGGPRSWRFLEISAVLDRALPELAEALGRRTADRSELDPMATLRWRLVDRILSTPPHDSVARTELARLAHPERLLLAALVLDTVGDGASVPIARRLAQRLEMGAAAEQEIALLIKDAGLMRAIAPRAGEEIILRTAAHLETLDRARALYLLSLALHELDAPARTRLDEVYALLQASLDAPELTARSARNVVQRRRAEAARVQALSPAAASRALAAPRPYVLAAAPEMIAQHATLLEPLPARNEVRVAVRAVGVTRWRVDVAARDRPGLLARATGVLLRAKLDVRDALVATWEDGGAIQSFSVAGDASPNAESLVDALEGALRNSIAASAVPDATIVFDNDISPWHTRCEIHALDRRGLLHRLASSLASSGVSIHSARVTTEGDEAIDVFEVTTLEGDKLDDGLMDRLPEQIRNGLATVARSGARARLARLLPRRTAPADV